MASSRTHPATRNHGGDGEKQVAQFQGESRLQERVQGFAVSQGITMTDLLKEGFARSKKKRQK
ncbi:hypothetical protein [Novosphingobium sp. CECT 9465]|uniref:hypothetical protein n=1 Tax=Novosphingobium sp. CECT 9465 TaxID=2829794 RepID=UPI001E635C69|nr:hypothetical protein [Novosphingobium sp. CECT 9465]